MNIKLNIFAILALTISCGSEQETPDIEQVNKENTEVILSESPSKFDPNTVKDISKSLPKQIKIKGELKNAYTWRDLNGENVLVNSIKITKRNSNDEHSGFLYSMHYLKKGNEYKLLIKTSDKEEVCDFDLHIDFKALPTIQDADANGIAEVIIAITKTCTGDVSPKTLKVLMHEDTNKYALRGTEHIVFTDEHFLPKDFEFNKEKYTGDKSDYTWQDGRYSNENEFENAPKSFVVEARKVWEDNSEWDFR